MKERESTAQERGKEKNETTGIHFSSHGAQTPPRLFTNLTRGLFTLPKKFLGCRNSYSDGDFL